MVSAIRRVKKGCKELKGDESLNAVGEREVNVRFQKLNLMGPLLRAVDRLGWKAPTAIQSAAIPAAIRGHNIVSSAETGTGKTAAYGLPMLHRLYIWKKYEERRSIERRSAPLCIVLCPTRELCEQVEKQVCEYAREMDGVRIVGVAGAMRDVEAQVRELKKGVDILVATPGRLLTMFREGVKEERKEGEETREMHEKWDKAWEGLDRESETRKRVLREELPCIPVGSSFKNSKIDFSEVRCFVLDEVDRMLSMGMFPEVRQIFRALPRPQREKRGVDRMQVMMFTATLVPRVGELIKRFAPHHVRFDLNKSMSVAERVEQVFYEVGNRRKYALLSYLLRRRGSMRGEQVLVFCRTRQRVERLTEQLNRDKIAAVGIHGSQPASVRRRIVDGFCANSYRVLVSTELMARGIDIPKLPVVVNYDLPSNPEEYVHRIGRTARAGESGRAVSFVSRRPEVVEVRKRLVELDELSLAKSIFKFLNMSPRFAKVPGPWRDEAKRPAAERERPLLDTSAKPPARSVS
ncbi:ATP-dependent RNA helicase RhlE-like, partial [Schistocerca gregaria]|uniref:ATP-dependent RNA helicase RhlE-like n=1 Tax=Schistocerca gregaria TaxID=7010 RepID=UPI00211DD548